MYVYIYIYVCTIIYIYVFFMLYIYIYTYIHIHTYTYIYIYMYIYIYVCEARTPWTAGPGATGTRSPVKACFEAKSLGNKNSMSIILYYMSIIFYVYSTLKPILSPVKACFEAKYYFFNNIILYLSLYLNF